MCSMGKLMRNTSLMTGASGGLVGASFFRELYLRKTQGENIDLYDDRYLHDIARDNLNAIVLAWWSTIYFSGFRSSPTRVVCISKIGATLLRNNSKILMVS